MFEVLQTKPKKQLYFTVLVYFLALVYFLVIYFLLFIIFCCSNTEALS
jgi:hypothetical protein